MLSLMCVCVHVYFVMPEKSRCFRATACRGEECAREASRSLIAIAAPCAVGSCVLLLLLCCCCCFVPRSALFCPFPHVQHGSPRSYPHSYVWCCYLFVSSQWQIASARHRDAHKTRENSRRDTRTRSLRVLCNQRQNIACRFISPFIIFISIVSRFIYTNRFGALEMLILNAPFIIYDALQHWYSQEGSHFSISSVIPHAPT